MNMRLIPSIIKKGIRKMIPALSVYDPKTYRTYRSFADPLLSPWLFDQAFLEDFQKAARDTGVGQHYADGRYLLTRFVRQALLSGEGDLIECGVHLGTSSYLIATMMDRYSQKDRTLFCIDSFEGFPYPVEKDANARTKKQFFAKGSHSNTSFEQVQKALLSNHRCSIQVIKGWIPEAFQKLERRFSFAHIDVDIYQPTVESLKYIYPRMEPNGIVLFDDYGFPMCPGAQLAVDEYLKDKKEILIPLPTGQAFFIKR
jgi:O-methyltransferase